MIDISQFQSSDSVYVRFSEDNPVDMKACELITERFVGMEAPLMCFSRDGVRTLVVPRTIMKVFPNAKPIATEAASVLRVPDRAGASNG